MTLIPAGVNHKLPDDDVFVDRLISGEASSDDLGRLSRSEARAIEELRAFGARADSANPTNSDEAEADLWRRIDAAQECHGQVRRSLA